MDSFWTARTRTMVVRMSGYLYQNDPIGMLVKIIHRTVGSLLDGIPVLRCSSDDRTVSIMPYRYGSGCGGRVVWGVGSEPGSVVCCVCASVVIFTAAASFFTPAPKIVGEERHAQKKTRTAEPTSSCGKIGDWIAFVIDPCVPK